jgi:hypothetical protein
MTREGIWEILQFNGVSVVGLSIRSKMALEGGITSNCSDFPAENINAPTDGCGSAKALGYITYTSIMAYKER